MDRQGIRPSPSKIQALKVWKCPTTVAEIRSVLGFVGYYRRFVPQFTEIEFPLTELTKKDARIPETGLTETQVQAFQALKFDPS